jgi:limonene-1,2-epoxide hydrolase
VKKKTATRDEQVVLHLFDAIKANDRERVLSFFTESTRFEPLARESVIGHAAIWAELGTNVMASETIEHELCCVVGAADGRVTTERIERRLIDGAWREQRVNGQLSVRGAKILHWSETGA